MESEPEYEQNTMSMDIHIMFRLHCFFARARRIFKLNFTGSSLDSQSLDSESSMQFGYSIESALPPVLDRSLRRITIAVGSYGSLFFGRVSPSLSLSLSRSSLRHIDHVMSARANRSSPLCDKAKESEN